MYVDFQACRGVNSNELPLLVLETEEDNDAVFV